MTTHSIADASLARLADGLLIPPFPGYSAPAWVLAALTDGLAGVTVFGPNIGGQAQLGSLIASLRSAADEPLVAIDEEGGDVTRIAHLSGSPYPGNAALGAVDDPALTQSVYLALGRDLAALGVNLNLAPSVDVNTAADNPVIGTRSFGADTGLVTRHAVAAVTGLQAAGVAACAKHFPGHGSTSNDSHHVIAAVDGSLDVVKRRDLPPFAAAIEAGVRAVMPGHLRVHGLTGDLPASLSAAALTGLLRGELGFTGVIVSDALEMRAVSGPFGIAHAAVLAVAAGTDLLCFGRDTDEPTYVSVRDALVEAVRSGQLPVARLEESAARVADLRGWAAARRSSHGNQNGSGAGVRCQCRWCCRGGARRGTAGDPAHGHAAADGQPVARRVGPAVQHCRRDGAVGPERLGSGRQRAPDRYDGGCQRVWRAWRGGRRGSGRARGGGRAVAARRRPGRASLPHGSRDRPRATRHQARYRYCRNGSACMASSCTGVPCYIRGN